MYSLLTTLEIAVRQLTTAGRSGGWGVSNQALGASLALKIGRWTPGQAITAWKMVQQYRQTTLSNLQLDYVGSPEALLTSEIEARQAARIAALPANGWGLTWSAPKTSKTAKGCFSITSAPIPAGHAFLDLWETQKVALQAQGYCLAGVGGDWGVTRRVLIDAKTADAVSTAAAPYELRPLKKTDDLLPWQPAAAASVCASLRSFGADLDASDLGTGKTYVALAACRELGLKPVVVAGKAALPAWQRAADFMGVELAAVTNWERIRRGTLNLGSWNKATRGSDQFVWSKDTQAVIFDEIHRAKGRNTQNARMVTGARRAGIPTLGLSATAARNPLDMWALGYLLGLHSLTDYWRWAQRHGCRPGKWGGFEYVGGNEVMAELHKEIYPLHGVRVRKSDLGDLFPSDFTTFEVVTVSDPEAINASYAEVAAAMTATKMKMVPGELAITRRLRARQISELGKVESIVEMTEALLDEGQHVIVFVCFEETRAQVFKEVSKLGVEVHTIHGQDNPEARQHAIDRFQANYARVLVVNIASAGESLGFHDIHGGHPRTTLISPPDKVLQLKQALGRAPRAGGKSPTRQMILLAGGTVEESIAKANVRQLGWLDALNDNDLCPVREKITGPITAKEKANNSIH